MDKIFENYVEHSFGGSEQAIFKFKQFEYNYRKFFPKHLDSAILLDVGIGRGEMLTCMKNWGSKNFQGVDISPSTVNFCQNLNLPCELVPDSTKYLNNHPSTFVAITLLDVLEHIPKHAIIEFLAALRTALKPGGVLIIQVPNLQAPDGHLHRYNDITHEVGFTEHSFAQVLMAAGFRKFKFIGFEEYVFGTMSERIRKIFRWFHWCSVHFFRGIDGNLNPKILNPVFSAIVYKDN